MLGVILKSCFKGARHVNYTVKTSAAALLLFSVFWAVNSAARDYHLECPGLPIRPGINLECVSTKLGALKFNCSSPVPVDTVVFYSCQAYYKEKSVPNFFDVRSMRCDRQGGWTRYRNFIEFKCEYECGKAFPNTKTAVVKGQLRTLTTWSWHALVYVKLNWAKVLEAIKYRRAVIATSSASEKYDNDEFYGDSVDVIGPGLGGEISTESTFALDPVKLAEIFNNDELSKEEIFDPRYRYIYICGGTLISDSSILTAGHCLTDSTGFVRAAKDFMVVLGGTSNDFYDNVDDPKSQIIPVKHLYVSDDFNYDEYQADIGIIELVRPPILNSAVLPACLPEDKKDAQSFISGRKQGEVIGSQINVFKEGVSNELKSKKLKVLPNIDCIKSIGRVPGDVEFCAGNLGADICSGDSGGGLVSAPNFGLRRRYTVQGIISYARTRRVCENYAVFTTVFKHLSWIKSIVFTNETIPPFLPMPYYF